MSLNCRTGPHVFCTERRKSSTPFWKRKTKRRRRKRRVSSMGQTRRRQDRRRDTKKRSKNRGTRSSSQPAAGGTGIDPRGMRTWNSKHVMGSTMAAPSWARTGPGPGSHTAMRGPPEPAENRRRPPFPVSRTEVRTHQDPSIGVSAFLLPWTVSRSRAHWKTQKHSMPWGAGQGAREAPTRRPWPA